MDSPVAVLGLVVSAIAALPLIYAGVAKVAEPQSFALAVKNYGLFSERVGIAVARVVPPCELLVGLGLLLVPQWLTAAIASATYLTFATVLIVAWSRGSRGNCGCFGSVSAAIGPGAAGRAVAFGACAAALTLVRLLLPAESGPVADRLALALVLVAGSGVATAALGLRPRTHA